MPFFGEREIRRIWDVKSETWFFSVVDIVQVITHQAMASDLRASSSNSAKVSITVEPELCVGILKRRG
jgi:hypothetical protein